MQLKVSGQRSLPKLFLIAATAFIILASAMALVLPAGAQEADVPSKPTGLTGTVSHNSVSLPWDDPGDQSITGYQILRRDKAIHDTGVFDVLLDDTGSSATSYTDNTVEADHEYVYRVKARNSAGLSPRSSYFDASTPETPEETTPTAEPTPTPEPTEGPTSTPEPTPEATPEPTPDATPEPTPEPTQAPAGNATQSSDSDSTRDGAIDLGDITDLESTIYPTYTINGDDDAVDYFKFTITEPKFVTTGIRQLDADATLTLERDDGTIIKSKSEPGAEHVMIYGTRLEGTYYLRVDADEAADNEYRLAHGVREPDQDKVDELREQQTETSSITYVDGASDSAEELTTLPSTVSDDCLDTIATTCVVTAGSSTSAEVEEEGDVDWIKLSPAANTPYRIEVSIDQNSNEALHHPYLMGIYGSDGNLLRNTEPDEKLIKTETSQGIYKRIYRFRADTADDVFITIHGKTRGPITAIGSYSVRVVEDTDSPDDYSARSTTTAKLTLGKTFTGNSERLGDIDWFKVDLEEGKTYRISLWSCADFQGLYYKDSSDQIVEGSLGTHHLELNGTDLAWLTATSTTTHYVSVKVGFSLGEYSIKVEEISLPDAEVASSTDTSETVSAGGSTYGLIDHLDDVDWIKVQLTEGATYNIELEGARHGQGTLSNLSLWGIYDSSGIITPGSVTVLSNLSYRAGATGDYYISVSSKEAIGVNDSERTGIFKLSVAWKEGPRSEQDRGADCSGDTNTICRLPVNGSSAGEVFPNTDKDWFRVNLEAGEVYRFELYDTGDSAAWISRLKLTDGTDTNDSDSGGFASSHDYTSGAEALVYRPRSDGDHFFEVHTWSGERSGSYKVKVDEIEIDEVDDCASDNTSSCSVPVGDYRVGYLEGGTDNDWWSVDLEAGETYEIYMEGTAKNASDYDNQGTVPDPRIKLYNSSNSEVAENDHIDADAQNYNSRIEYTVPDGAGGTYHISTDCGEGFLGTYVLAVSLSE